MIRRLLHYLDDGVPRWGERLEGGVRPLPRELVSAAEAVAALRASSPMEPPSLLDEASLGVLAPVTRPCRIVCQGKNYAEHRLETGSRAERPPFNLLFSKADGALTGARGAIVRPPHVQLLDYEVELALVIGRPLAGARIDHANWHEYVLGLTLANDVSARDVQLGHGQWFRGKSYPTFLPLGPYLVVPDEDAWRRFAELRLRLWVDGELRQEARAGAMLYPPWETLAELAESIPLEPGDLLLTGTPGGVAMKVPSGPTRKLAELLLPEARRMAHFVRAQRRSGRYLREGQTVEARLDLPELELDLGRHALRVEAR